MKHRICLILALVFASAQAQVVDYKVEGDGIPRALTGTPGNAARGRALIAKKEAANCLQCHAIKDKDMAGGSKGPALDGIGANLTPAQLRLSVVDNTRVSRGSAMPSFHKAGTLQASDAAKPVLGAQEIEDVVAYLATLRR